MFSVEDILPNSVKLGSPRLGPSFDNTHTGFHTENFSRSKVQQLLTNCEGELKKRLLNESPEQTNGVKQGYSSFSEHLRSGSACYKTHFADLTA